MRCQLYLLALLEIGTVVGIFVSHCIRAKKDNMHKHEIVVTAVHTVGDGGV